MEELVSRLGTPASKTGGASGGPCYRCGGTGHNQRSCGFKDATCHNCGKRGHIRRACRGRRRPAGVQNVEDQHPTDDGGNQAGL